MEDSSEIPQKPPQIEDVPDSDSAGSKTVPETPQGKRKISRRDFLKIVGAGVGAAALGGSHPPPEDNPPLPDLTHPLPNPPEHPNTIEKTPEKRLERLGMSDFIEFYKSLRETDQKFHSRTGGYYFHRLFDVCQKIADGSLTDYNDPAIREVRDGWGVDENRSVEEARDRIKSLEVLPIEDTTDDPELVKQKYLIPFAESFAPMAHALPDTLFLSRFGRVTNPDTIVTYSFDSYSPETAWSIFFHEATHASDVYNKRLQPYTSRKKYLEYAQAYYEHADTILTNWYSLEDEAKAIDFWEKSSWGLDFIPPFPNEETKDLIMRVENTLNSTPKEQSWISRFKKVAWKTGKKIQELNMKRDTGESLTREDEEFLDHPDIVHVMSRSMAETLHALVYSDSSFEPDSSSSQPTNIVQKAQNSLQNARIRTFASFDVDPAVDPAQQLRNRLGL